jgi:hypothetical protein
MKDKRDKIQLIERNIKNWEAELQIRLGKFEDARKSLEFARNQILVLMQELNDALRKAITR